MKKGNPRFKKIPSQIDELANIMAKVVGDMEGRLDEMGTEQSVLKNHYTTLSNRVSYLEKKF